MAKVSTYLNFPGNTEEVFLFYRSVFRSDFSKPIQRFGEMPSDPNAMQLSDKVKNMVLHVELPILGGHKLMGTDASEDIGLFVEAGNNVHLSLEPDTRDEATRLFNELSEGGEVLMPLQDVFWGAYYGSLTDKYGINWMVNFQEEEAPNSASI